MPEVLEWPIEIITDQEISKKTSTPENKEEPRQFFHHIKEFHLKNSEFHTNSINSKSRAHEDLDKIALEVTERETPLYFSSNFAVPITKGKPKMLPIVQAVLEHTVEKTKKALVLFSAEAEAIKARLQQEVRRKPPFFVVTITIV